jgi:uncharacterized protein (DUF169 family)
LKHQTGETHLKTIDEYKTCGRDLFHKLHLSTYPVAIKYLTDAKDIPKSAVKPSGFGQKMSLCQAFTQARRWGVTVAMTADDNFCTPATAIHRWKAIDLPDLIESQVRQGWHKNREAEQRRFASITALFGEDYFSKPPRYCGFICAPLTEASFAPDSVLIYGDGVQLTHIIQALSYEHLHVPTSSFEGFEESCVKGGLLPFLTGKPQIVLPGAGDRAFAAISEHEIGIGLPAELVFYVHENLFKTGGFMNLGFPMKQMLPMGLNEQLTPGFKFLWDKMFS